MKKVFNILASVALLAGVVGCEVEYDPIIIIPNPALDKTGIQEVNTISIYDEQETVINIARTAGLSKEMNMNVVVDKALIDEYNFQNGTSYELLPAEYYTLPENILLPKETLDVNFTAVIKPAAITNGLGRAEASNYLLPLRLESPATGIDNKQDMITVMLRPMIEDPKVTVEMPDVMPSLDFISIVQLSQTVELNAVANFNTLDVNKIEFEILGQTEIDAYNEANGTEFVLLDAEWYEVTEKFDAEAMIYKTAIEFSCWTLDDTKVYMLPVRATSSAYGVEQEEIIYIAIQMSELKVFLSNAEMKGNSNTVEVAVELNTAMENDFEFDIAFDASLVDAYNAANGTSYTALDSNLITVGKAHVPAGSKVGKAVVELDMGAIPYDAGRFVAPLVISNVPEGTVVIEDKKTTYMLVYNTIVGIYQTNKDWRSAWNNGGCYSKPMSNWGDNIYDIRLATDTPAGAGRQGQKYASKYSYNMYAYFDVDWTKEIDPSYDNAIEVDGLPAFAEKAGSGCYAIVNVVERGLNEAGPDPTKRNYSYVDTNTGIVYFDFIIEGYWSPGGPGGKEMPAGCTIGGDWFCARFTDRVDHE